MKHLNFAVAILLAFVASSFTLPGIEKTSPETAPPAIVDYFLKIEGVDGESADKDHKNWIDVYSCNLNRSGRTLEIKRFQTPIASRALQNLFQSKAHIKKAVLHVRKAGDSNYLEYKLEDVLVTSYQTSASSDGRPTEEVTFVFGKVIVRP